MCGMLRAWNCRRLLCRCSGLVWMDRARLERATRLVQALPSLPVAVPPMHRATQQRMPRRLVATPQLLAMLLLRAHKRQGHQLAVPPSQLSRAVTMT